MDREVRSVALRGVSWALLSCLLLLLPQGQGAAVQDKQSSPRNSCPAGSLTYSSYCYAFYKDTKTWMDAHLDCQKRHGGHLTTVLSGSEASFLSSLIRSNGNTYSYIWIGLHDPTEGALVNAGGWEWSNRDIMNYRAWERMPPTTPEAGYCGTVSRSSDYKKWKDYNCDRSLPYICKFKS